jgi:hypothetical protein
MGVILDLFYWFKDNYVEFFSSLGVIMVGIEMLVRLTPTKKDDTAAERVGEKLRKIMDFMKIPNPKLENGKVSKHELREE